MDNTNRPEKKFIMLDDNSFQVVKKALNHSVCRFKHKAMSAIVKGNRYSSRAYVEEFDCIERILGKLEGKEFYFMGALSESQKRIVKDSLIDYKNQLRGSAFDYKVGLETEENRQNFSKYIVLGGLINRLSG